MLLYHGTDKRIEHPNCKAGRKNLDFGEGFYTTLLREHAEGWANQVAFNNRTNTPVVNVCEFDKETALAGCRYLHFPKYDEVWMDFIVASRLGRKPWEGYDLIEGGIANDRVIDTIRLYMYGDMGKQTALRRLSEHSPNHQMTFLKQELVDRYLFFVESIEL